MNPQSYPPDIQEFVQQVIATGEYTSEDEVYVDAVRTLRELKHRHQALRADIQVAIAELDAGQGEPWDIDELKQELSLLSGGDPVGNYIPSV